MAELDTPVASAASALPPAAEALLEARPPATDRFTYLTLIQETLSPEVLPTLHDVLKDVQLTQDIGWDLVETLVPLLPASEACLDDVARLGNPREVILKVLEVLEGLKTRQRHRPSNDEDGGEGGEGGEGEEGEEEESAPDDNEEEKEDPQTAEATTRTFVVLLGMLSVLHRRIKTKFPSRFLETTLRTILAAYRPERLAMTTAVLGLVRSLAANKRPLPPLRRSESHLMMLDQPGASGAPTANNNRKTSKDISAPEMGALTRKTSAIGQVASNTDQTDESAVSIPDPEAEDLVDPAEGAVQQRLLQSFVTCILEAYVNANEIAWAPRLYEFYHANKLVPGRPTALQSFREDPKLVARDSTVGKLVALVLDLGLKYSDAFVRSVGEGPVRRNPLAVVDIAAAGSGVDGPDGIPLSTGGTICLLAYWVFSAEIFKADSPVPVMHIFPDHYAILKTYLEGGAASEVARTPGTVEAIVTIGLWLEHHGLYFESQTSAEASTASLYMPYHHLLTLCSMFHPSLPVRSAATALAGAVLHADPDPEDRLKILQDLLENCMFASLKACAVTWLREEIIAAGNSVEAGAQKTDAEASTTSTAAASEASAASAAPAAAVTTPSSPFATADAVEQLQYAVFPDLQALEQGVTATAEDEAPILMLEYWIQNAPFLLQTANFAYFLFRSERFRATVVPPGMGPAIGQRYVEPLVQAATRLRQELGESNDKVATAAEPTELEHISLDLEVLASRLQSLELS